MIDYRTLLWIGLTAAFLLLLFLIFLLRRLKQEDPLPEGKIIYEDLSEAAVNNRTLYSPKYDLSGRPDMILKRGGQLVPVEVKTMKAPAVPYDGHIAQLTAYCLLIEECMGISPAYGFLKYKDKTFEIAYTLKRRKELLATLREIKNTDWKRNIHRSHGQKNRCAHCGFREICSESLSSEKEE